MGLRGTFAAAADLVATRDCAGCGVRAVRWCPGCAQWLAETPVLPRRVSGFSVISATEYAGPVRSGICTWKEADRSDLTAVWAQALGPLVRSVVRLGGPAPLLVPVPSSAAARRRRGWQPVLALARALRSSTGLPSAPLLWAARLVADQAGLGAVDRQQNLAGAFAVRRSWERIGLGRPVVLIDDVITTGATVKEGIRALTGAGVEVTGVVTIAATPGPQRN